MFNSVSRPPSTSVTDTATAATHTAATGADPSPNQGNGNTTSSDGVAALSSDPRPSSPLHGASAGNQMRGQLKRKWDQTSFEPIPASQSLLAPYAPDYQGMLNDEMSKHTVQALKNICVTGLTQEARDAAKMELKAREPAGVLGDYLGELMTTLSLTNAYLSKKSGP